MVSIACEEALAMNPLHSQFSDTVCSYDSTLLEEIEFVQDLTSCGFNRILTVIQI